MKRSVFIAACLICISLPALADDSGFYPGTEFANGRLSACTNTTSSCDTFRRNSKDSGIQVLIISV